jgi:error-prone DNA polymerase
VLSLSGLHKNFGVNPNRSTVRINSGSLPEDLIRRAAELELPGIALLDRDTISGAVRFHLPAKEAGIKAIVGAEVMMEDKSLLPLIPLNLKGYQNICKLLTTIKLRAKKGELNFCFELLLNV